MGRCPGLSAFEAFGLVKTTLRDIYERDIDTKNVWDMIQNAIFDFFLILTRMP